jgi:hypothetical protein
MQDASKYLHLNMCRVKQLREDYQDSYLVFYTKAGIRDYSGPFMMLREKNFSKLLVIGPHDDSDGTAYDTKLATANTKSMGTISNGHRRGNVRKGRPPGYRNDDMVHSDNKTTNLGTWAVAELGRIKPGSVVLHVHGMAKSTTVMDRSRSKNMYAAFEKAVMKHTYITEFERLNASFSIDPVVNTNYYLKTEIPVRIHNNYKYALTNIVKDIEQYDWAKN